MNFLFYTYETRIKTLNSRTTVKKNYISNVHEVYDDERNYTSKNTLHKLKRKATNITQISLAKMM